jgi:hypothetical protein
MLQKDLLLSWASIAGTRLSQWTDIQFFHGHSRPKVRFGVPSSSSLFALSSSTSQYDQTNFPFKNSASGLASQTKKPAVSSTKSQLFPLLQLFNFRDSPSSKGRINPASIDLLFIADYNTPGCT